MSDAQHGRIMWQDLTVPNAEEVRDFYSAVVGWTHVDLEGDYSMIARDGEAAAGICHARGVNANLPPQWLVYIVVPDVDAAVAECERRNGKLIDGPRPAGQGRIAVIQDPAGAACALYQE